MVFVGLVEGNEELPSTLVGTNHSIHGGYVRTTGWHRRALHQQGTIKLSKPLKQRRLAIRKLAHFLVPTITLFRAAEQCGRLQLENTGTWILGDRRTVLHVAICGNLTMLQRTIGFLLASTISQASTWFGRRRNSSLNPGVFRNQVTANASAMTEFQRKRVDVPRRTSRGQ